MVGQYQSKIGLILLECVRVCVSYGAAVLYTDLTLRGFFLLLCLCLLSAKKLPKNEGAGPQQNIRPTQNETNRQNSGCCAVSK